MPTVHAKLEAARRDLLDLTRRNRLLNFKPRGRTSIRIVDELPEEVYRILVSEGKRMQFRSLEESPEDATADPDPSA